MQPVVADGTTGREARPKAWVAARVQMCLEKRIAMKLTRLGYENFVPVQREIHRWSDRRKAIDRVVLPTVVFFHADEREQQALVRFSFINYLIGYPGERRAAPIPDIQMERFRKMLQCRESTVNIEPAPLTVGEEVVITGGSLRGLCGELVRVQDGQSHVIVRIGALGCASIDIPSNFVARV